MSARPRGFIQRWTPRAETHELLDQANQVLAEYIDLLPLTLRQIFYRLVGAYGYAKTEQASERLGEMLNKSPAGLVDMDAIRDDGFTSAAPVFFGDVDDFFATVADWAEGLRFDRQAGQQRRLALWCEAAGMVPQLERVAAPFGVGAHSSGGFDSLTDKHCIGREWSGAPITVLHLGDHDPSGVHCFSALEGDVVALRPTLRRRYRVCTARRNTRAGAAIPPPIGATEGNRSP